MPRKHSKIDGGYIVIPKRTIRCKQYKALSNTTKLVYQAFLMEFIRDSKLNPLNKLKVPHSQLEIDSGVSHGSVIRGVKILKKKGFIRVLKQGGFKLNLSTYQLNGRYTDSGSVEARW